MENSFDRGDRLKLERERLKIARKNTDKLTIKRAAEVAGCGEQTWIRFEKGEPMNQDHIERLQDFGFDMQYVVFGIRGSTEVSAEELQVIDAYRKTKPSAKAGLVGMINAYAVQNPHD